LQVTLDHASLQWLIKQKELTSRLARWEIKLQGFSFKISHRSGSQNVVSDSLSRQNELNAVELDDHGPMIDLDSDEFMSHEYCNLLY